MWIDVGGATCEAEQIEYVEDVRAVHAGAVEGGMKSMVRLRSGKWFYARFKRQAIMRRVAAADHGATEGT